MNLPKPVRRQREVLYMPPIGHSVVLGAAGSGKTTLALYRAAYLSEQSMPHSGKTLLLTYNKLLTTYLQHLESNESSNIEIRTYHSFALSYLRSCGKTPDNCVCKEPKRYINLAVREVESKYRGANFFRQPGDFFENEIKWIFSCGITSSDEYVKANRTGLDTRVVRDRWPVMYEIIEKYREIRNKYGYMYDWDDIALHARKEFEIDESTRLYKHIIIDEGQDFSPEMVRSLAAAVPADGSLTFFGDVAQQIYGQGMSWRSAGLKVADDEIWRFKENYRNTKQIAQLGLAISQMPFFKNIPDLVEPISPIADGALPILAKFRDRGVQVDEIAKVVASSSLKTEKVAILLKDKKQVQEIAAVFKGEATQLHRALDTWNDMPGIYYGTYHSAKGLEFDTVILPFLDSENMPATSYINSHGIDEARTYYGRLLYVAVTRAKSRLLLFYSGELTQLMPKPKGKGLYREIN